MLKAPGTERLKLQYDEPPAKFAFRFNLRHYTWVDDAKMEDATATKPAEWDEARAYTRSVLSST
jgi:hypothetical protein